MKPQELMNARHTARISKTKDADNINTLLMFLSDMEPGTYTHEVTSEAVRDAVRNARTSPRRVFTEMIREAMTEQPRAVQILILLTLCLIVLAMLSLIVGLMAGASAQVFFGLMLTRGPMEIRDWYVEKFPEDLDVGGDIRPSITFDGLYEALDRGKDVYDFLGAHDSIVRERCFEELAEIAQKPYDYIYNQWINPQ